MARTRVRSVGGIDAERVQLIILWAVEQAGFSNPNQWKKSANELGYNPAPTLDSFLKPKKQHWTVGSLLVLAEIFAKQGVLINGQPMPRDYLISALIIDYENNIDPTEIYPSLSSAQNYVELLSPSDRAKLAASIVGGLSKEALK